MMFFLADNIQGEEFIVASEAIFVEAPADGKVVDACRSEVTDPFGGRLPALLCEFENGVIKEYVHNGDVIASDVIGLSVDNVRHKMIEVQNAADERRVRRSYMYSGGTSYRQSCVCDSFGPCSVHARGFRRR